MHNVTLIFIAGAVVIAGCNRTSPNQLRMGEGRATSDDLSVTNGNVIVKEGQLGIAFAFATKPGQSKEFTYFVVFNHDFPNGGVETKSHSDGSSADSFHTITAFGTDCKVEYRIALKHDRKTVERETVLVADVPYDPSEGKLFLIDMKAAPPTVMQLNLELPSEIPNLKEVDAAEKFGQDTLNTLRKLDRTVDEFRRRVETKGT